MYMLYKHISNLKNAHTWPQNSVGIAKWPDTCPHTHKNKLTA